MLQTLAVGQTHRTPGLFYNKVLTVSCNWSNTLLKVKTSGCMSAELLWVYWFIHASGVTGWELWLGASVLPHERGGTAHCQPRKRFKFKVWSTIFTENISLAHHCKVKKIKPLSSEELSIYLVDSIGWRGKDGEETTQGSGDGRRGRGVWEAFGDTTCGCVLGFGSCYGPEQTDLGDMAGSVPDYCPKSESNEFFHFPMHIKITFVLYCSLVSMW